MLGIFDLSKYLLESGQYDSTVLFINSDKVTKNNIMENTKITKQEFMQNYIFGFYDTTIYVDDDHLEADKMYFNYQHTPKPTIKTQTEVDLGNIKQIISVGLPCQFQIDKTNDNYYCFHYNLELDNIKRTYCFVKTLEKNSTGITEKDIKIIYELLDLKSLLYGGNVIKHRKNYVIY